MPNSIEGLSAIRTWAILKMFINNQGCKLLRPICGPFFVLLREVHPGSDVVADVSPEELVDPRGSPVAGAVVPGGVVDGRVR